MSIRSNLWIVTLMSSVIVAILSYNHLILNYVHVFMAVLWTGTDILWPYYSAPT